MRNNVALVGAIVMNLGLAGVSAAQTDPNPAVNDPDRQSWELFMTVNANAASAGHNNALFETWASDGDTFQPSPVWPSGGAQMQIGSRALSLVLQQVHPRFAPRVVPGGKALVGEETRRNKPDFDFIVQNKLFKVSGLRTVFEALKPITFPVNSMEVKANWVEVGRLKEFNGFTGTPVEAAAAYHVNSTGGIQYALVSFHIISKLVPNWTWATFEHRTTRGDATSSAARIASARSTRMSRRSPQSSLRPITPIAPRRPLFSRSLLRPMSIRRSRTTA